MMEPPPLLAQAVRQETDGTRILWSARPSRWDHARKQLPQALIGIPFAAFAVFWTWEAFGGLAANGGKGPPIFFALWGSMFILIGLAFLLSPLFAFWKAGRMFFVVTEKSALIFEKIWGVRIHSFDASSFRGFERVSRGDSSGDILFRRNIERRGKGTRITEIGFFGLEDFMEAERALRSMVDSWANRTTPWEE